MSSGLCQNWYNQGGNLRMRVGQGSNITSSEFFTFGSHKDDVVRLQGNPKEVSINRTLNRETWIYHSYNSEWLNSGLERSEFGLVSVTFSFSTGLLIGWRGAKSLNVLVIPGPNVTSGEYFTPWSHKDDVARIQGTPNEALIKEKIHEETWQYSGGAVDFIYPSGFLKVWYGNGLKARK